MLLGTNYAQNYAGIIGKALLIRGVARIFKGGVQFAQILPTTPTFYKPRPFIRKLEAQRSTYEGFFKLL